MNQASPVDVASFGAFSPALHFMCMLRTNGDQAHLHPTPQKCEKSYLQGTAGRAHPLDMASRLTEQAVLKECCSAVLCTRPWLGSGGRLDCVETGAAFTTGTLSDGGNVNFTAWLERIGAKSLWRITGESRSFQKGVHRENTFGRDLKIEICQARTGLP